MGATSSKEIEMPEAQVRRVAVESDADPRTVRRVLRGEATRGMAAERIRTVLRRMGLLGKGNHP